MKELATEQLAYMWGVNKKTIAEWCKGSKGWLTPAKLRRGKFDAHTANRLYIENQIIPKYARPDTGEESLDEAKRRKEIAQANIKELQEQELRGDLIDKGEAIKWVGGLASEARTSFLALPRRIAPTVYGKEPREVEIMIRDEVYRILNRITRNIETGKVKPVDVSD